MFCESDRKPKKLPGRSTQPTAHAPVPTRPPVRKRPSQVTLLDAPVRSNPGPALPSPFSLGNTPIAFLPPRPEIPLTGLVTIDGGPRTGKSTLAETLAKNYGGIFLSSGHIYRAIASQLSLEDRGAHPRNLTEPEERQIKEALASMQVELRLAPKEENGKKYQEVVISINGNPPLAQSVLERDEVALIASSISANSSVRSKIRSVLKAFVSDYQEFLRGSPYLFIDGRDMGSLFPQAGKKIFLTVSAEEAARRSGAGENTAIRAKRDQSVTERAPDSVTLDTTGLSAATVFLEAQKVLTSAPSVGLPLHS